jgi:uncharacterized membrane protein/thiol-disulfide isomerase/thioredoxin
MFHIKITHQKSIFILKISIIFLVLSQLMSQANLIEASGRPAENPGDIVRAVLFFSPTCGHCHKVIEEDIPPLIERYGERLEILMIDISTSDGRQLFQSAAEFFGNLREIRGVPTLVIGEQVLIGSREIPEQFPGLIDIGLNSGGVEWPAIPGLTEFIQPQADENLKDEALPLASQTQSENNDLTPTADALAEASTRGQIASTASFENSTEVPIYIQRFMQDPIGNSIAVLTLLGMLISVVIVGYYFLRTPGEDHQKPHALSWPRWAIPALSLAGLGVAGYMSYVELTHVEAICGPLGDCNSVQQSPYAILWGFLPVGILGIIGYLAIGVVWFVQNSGPASWRNFLAIIMWGMALLGTLFSIYLTFLEPFVIGATCAWCISSAVIITMLLWATTGTAIQALPQVIDEN